MVLRNVRFNIITARAVAFVECTKKGENIGCNVYRCKLDEGIFPMQIVTTILGSFTMTVIIETL